MGVRNDQTPHHGVNYVPIEIRAQYPPVLPCMFSADWL